MPGYFRDFLASIGIQTDTAAVKSVALRQLFVHGTDVEGASTPVLLPKIACQEPVFRAY